MIAPRFFESRNSPETSDFLYWTNGAYTPKFRRNHDAKHLFASRWTGVIVVRRVVVRTRTVSTRERRKERYVESVQLERELQHPLRRSTRWCRVLLPRCRWTKSRQELPSGRRHVRILSTLLFSVSRVCRFQLPHGRGELRGNLCSKLCRGRSQTQQGLAGPTYPRVEGN